MNKMGRNEPCWCGSGKKYKKCHLHRAYEDRTRISDAIQNMGQFKKDRGCNAPPHLHHQCQGKSINSHTISKSLGLTDFAENGHVLGLKHDMSTLIKRNGIPSIEAIGVNRISVFPGFCKKHDKDLFSEIEDKPFSMSEKQCALLSYRAIAREKHTKISGIAVNDFMRGMDKGLGIFPQMSIQALATGNGEGLSLAKDDLASAADMFHSSIRSDDYSPFESLIFQLPPQFPVLCTTAHMPHEDWTGSIVQDLTDPTLKADWVTAAAIHTGGFAWVVFTWNRKASKIKKFVQTIISHYRTNIADALVKYFFTISENIAIRPSWWNGLSEAQKSAITARVMDGNPLVKNDNIIFPKLGEPVVIQLNEIAVHWV